jgi:hypothetical protein
LPFEIQWVGLVVVGIYAATYAVIMRRLQLLTGLAATRPVTPG